MSRSSKLIRILLWVTAITAFSFLTMVELFNRLTLDDLSYALRSIEYKLGHHTMELYFTLSGKFMAFFFNEIQIKSFLFFNSMLPFSISLYALNVFLISKSLVNFFKINNTESLLFSIIFFQLYVYSMFDVASYFWMCTKGYTFEMSLGLFTLSVLICNKKESFLNYAVLFIALAFLGCSYEIYAPIILLLMGLVLAYKFFSIQYNIRQLIINNRKLFFSFIVGTIFFTLMVIAPGNLARLNMYSEYRNLSKVQVLGTSIINCFHLVKLLFFKIHYFILFLVLLYVLMTQYKSNIHQVVFEKRILIKKICFYLFIAVGLAFISVLLNTYACGKRMELRAFNHINLLLFLFIGFSLFEISIKFGHKKVNYYLFPISLIFIIVFDLYNIFSNYSELKIYTKSCDERFGYLEGMKIAGNKTPIQLKELDVAVYHSVDDLWRIVLPKYSRSPLLLPNEVSDGLNHPYNINFKKYYKLDFEVYTTLHYGM